MKNLTEPGVVSRAITWLSNNGYRNIKSKALKEHGVDIVANTKYGRFVYVECKGEARRNSQRENNFVYAIGQIVTRMSHSEYQSYGLVYPHSYHSKLKRFPWQFAKRNNVFVLLISDRDKIKKYDWKELKKIQTSSK